MSDLTPADLHLLWHTYERWEEGDDFAEHMSSAVESILAAHLAPVVAERDEAVRVFALWQRAEYEAHHDGCKSRAELLRQKWQNAEADRRAAEQQAADLRAELDGLRASIEALAAGWDDDCPDAPAGTPCVNHDHADELRALLDNPGAALDAVRAEAKAEERERIALAIEAWGDGRPNAASWQTTAARIAREEVQA